eukprot:TRINITY_DN3497_c0_g1_i12.p2 TRINITY_DN3497_c0_g1~~TRINITY_DN3497_c0_g1_i12.p2  ORF type:complete len:118 (+),score=25.47 TRINITY_DN3497_c0_g1_i12:91-444(+)
MFVFFCLFFFLMIRRPPRSTQGVSSAASDVYKRQGINAEYMGRGYERRISYSNLQNDSRLIYGHCEVLRKPYNLIQGGRYLHSESFPENEHIRAKNTDDMEEHNRENDSLSPKMPGS